MSDTTNTPNGVSKRVDKYAAAIKNGVPQTCTADLGVEGKLENIQKPGDLFTAPGVAIVNGDDIQTYGTVELLVGTIPDRDQYNKFKEDAMKRSNKESRIPEETVLENSENGRE